jgi:hypothetical protein
MRIILNKTIYEGGWKTVKTFAIIPKICYDPESYTTVIVWLEYIYKIYKHNFDSNKYIFDGNRTINKTK